MTMARIPVNTQLRRGGRKRPEAPAVPMDARVMNALALVLALAACAFLVQHAWAVMKRAPMFTVRTITVDGDLQRMSVPALRALAAPKAAGNFFGLDMAQVRAAFETVPWVRRAHVRRQWPNGLSVTLEEHRAVALWDGEDGLEALVNEYGEVFEANAGEVEEDDLPTLSGPAGSSRHVLTTHQRLVALMAPMAARVESLHLTPRGAWQLTLQDGAVLELGRGNDHGDTAEVMERTARFVRTFAEVSERFGRPPLIKADLRHTNGYALQLKGVTLVQPVVTGKPELKR